MYEYNRAIRVAKDDPRYKKVGLLLRKVLPIRVADGG